MKINVLITGVLGVSLLVACSTYSTKNSSDIRTPSQVAISAWLNGKPTANADEVKALTEAYIKKTKPLTKTMAMPTPSFDQMQKIAHYVEFLNIPAESKTETISRLMESSTQFLFCDNLEDWACLEQAPTVVPAALYRIESEADLGKPVTVASPFKMNYFFTRQWYKTHKELLDGSAEAPVPEKAQLATELNKVMSQDWARVSAAIYGIDGIGEIESKAKGPNTSMMDVYNSIKKQKNIRVVVDVDGFTNLPDGKKQIKYQYPTTQLLLDSLNLNQPLESTRLRLEYPADPIMHNKFFVFDNGKEKSVWTGTANISKNCTGDENYANMAVYIQNNEIADSYQKEFEEMFNFAPAGTIKAPQPVGRFHQNKRPNTKRYFTFNDGTEVKLYFSPTDDGEHRSIIPMLLSAREGDTIRISMFGTSGLEYVRALQYAAARGAHVKVFLDGATNFSVSTSWINRKSNVRLQGLNPYGPVKGSIEIRTSNWSSTGLNHHKSATLTRAANQGEIPQLLIVGSQNWSQPGNDGNDENMLTIRNTNKGLDVVRDYNTHFDSMIWPTGKIVPME